MIDYLIENQDWLFSGAGISLFTALFYLFYRKESSMEERVEENTAISNVNPQQTVNLNISNGDIKSQGSSVTGRIKNFDRKEDVRILFVDDDTKFKVVRILINSGWEKTTIQKDVSSLDESSVRDAHMLFVDIQGVGMRLGFKDEGLGLALALKEKYGNEKVVVIYSAEQTGDRFHEGLRRADDFLRKSAEPYEFEKLITSHFNIGKA